ncbi:MAG: hypothetical protein KIT45_12600 [Fimbriimonadia bacterium]|nr:hypothetical protein [Fimbriimonadia bacterium]
MQDRWLMTGIFFMGILFAVAAMQIGKGFFPTDRAPRVAAPSPASKPVIPPNALPEGAAALDRLNGSSRMKESAQELNMLYQRALSEIDQHTSKPVAPPAMTVSGPPPAFSSSTMVYTPPPPIHSTGPVPTQLGSSNGDRRTLRPSEFYRQAFDAWSGRHRD